MTQPVHTQQDPGSHPPPPWRMQSQMWMGLYTTDKPLPLPPGMRPFLSPRWLLVSLVRYLGGTLQYDELVVSGLVRRGLRVGVLDHFIWVNNAEALWGGRRIWGVPKEFASFEWTGDTVVVAEKAGPIATISVNREPVRGPQLRGSAPFFGLQEERCLYTQAEMKLTVGKSQMRVMEWADRFPFRIAGAPRVGFRADPVEINVPAPRVLSG